MLLFPDGTDLYGWTVFGFLRFVLTIVTVHFSVLTGYGSRDNCCQPPISYVCLSIHKIKDICIETED